MTKFLSVVLVCAIGLAIQGCATITCGSDDVLEINTTPSGAQVTTSSGLSCTSTPCVLKMPRKSEIMVTITKRGCQTAIVNVTHRTADSGAAGIENGGAKVGHSSGGIGLLLAA